MIPGDIGSEIDRIEQVFETLNESHNAVMYIPGNHEAWRRGGTSVVSAQTPELRTSTTNRMATDSIAKIEDVAASARRLGVYLAPVRFSLSNNNVSDNRAVCVFPMWSWYHAGWDREPGLEDPLFTAVEKAVPFQRKWGDFSMCSWPESLISQESFASVEIGDTVSDNTVLAEAWGSLNEPFLNPPTQEETKEMSGKGGSPIIQDSDTVISFSHFLPRQELCPEKRFLTEPLLSRVIGSDPLEAQVRRLNPDLHLFGHTHIPIDLELEGIRYLQWPLGYSREANMQCAPVRAEGALLVYDSSLGDSAAGIPEMAPSKDSYWSKYYRSKPRKPEVIAPLAPWVVNRLNAFSGFVKSNNDDDNEAVDKEKELKVPPRSPSEGANPIFKFLEKSKKK